MATPVANDDSPAWLNRIRSRLHTVPQDPARNIFLERGFDAVIELTQSIPKASIEATAAAGSNVLVLLRALQSPEVMAELERYEPLSSPYLKGVEAQQALLKAAGGLMTSEEVGRTLALTRQAIDKRRQANKLIAISQGQHRFGYPACQLNEKGPIPGLEPMLEALGQLDGWMQLTFLLTPNTLLADRSPIDLLREGRVAPVIAAAESFGEHGSC